MKKSKWAYAYLWGLITAVLAPWALVSLNYVGVADDADLVIGIPSLAVAGFVLGYIVSLVISVKKIK